MKKEKNMKRGMAIIGRMVLFCMGLLSALVVSCDSELEVQQSYPFSVETMPVPKELEKNETAEIRCELKSEGDFDGTIYTIRYFQYDGEGSLKLDNGLEFKPNDRYLLENRKFRLYYTSLCEEAQNLIITVEDNWGNTIDIELDFNSSDDGEEIPEETLPEGEGGAR
ncbi:DUF3872 domain-containing protein [Bacteroides thetaiotaomicron]|uniref:DUF3872 domain-containing protein n=1 Tax=Bacteroides thetaiotaomicron TaxID=818 RepID=UPI001F1BDF7A|nr:DUF3872 domain-containing protein [Bacteroides thetaiotaomicron]MCE8489277.1 DUF3872 domain-containing protein [Bacteroides thetaiotaomicron]